MPMQVNLKSTNLETHLFKKVLSELIGRGVPVKELVTDANCQIISVMSEFILYIKAIAMGLERVDGNV